MSSEWRGKPGRIFILNTHISFPEMAEIKINPGNELDCGQSPPRDTIMIIEKMWALMTKSFALYRKEDTPERRRKIRRTLIILMVLVTIVPLTFLAVINFHQYQISLKRGTISPLKMLANKTVHSFDLLLEERLATVKFIASAYSVEELSDQTTLNRIFNVLKLEFGVFVDLGLIDTDGVLVNYAGPYKLLGKNYSQQNWFKEIAERDSYISDVFMGYRQKPHIAIVVHHMPAKGQGWYLRATIDTKKFDALIAAMGLDSESEAFIINYDNILQTDSKHYGKVLDESPFLNPLEKDGSKVVEQIDFLGRKVFVIFTCCAQGNYTLIIVKPSRSVLKTSQTLKNKIFLIYIISVFLIVLVIFKLADVMIKHIKEAVEKRELALRELEHAHKLSSIGRLAAGIAHEINNPLAIINEKAGLIQDIIEYGSDFKERKKILNITDSIIQSVERSKRITHRLLGFARQIDVQLESLCINEIIKEVIGFLESASLGRNIDISLELDEKITNIFSDKGQLQQVFLNILTNAFAAVQDSGHIAIRSWEKDSDVVCIAITDDGCGMREDLLKRIFEPFFTTKKGYGTGLGLPITYGIIKKLGGDIKANSKEGEGTTFTVFLPKQYDTATGGGK